MTIQFTVVAEIPDDEVDVLDYKFGPPVNLSSQQNITPEEAILKALPAMITSYDVGEQFRGPGFGSRIRIKIQDRKIVS